MSYKESDKYLKEEEAQAPAEKKEQQQENVEQKLLEQVLKCPPKDAEATIKCMDKFCTSNPLMNVGPGKSQILADIIDQYKPKNILELGCYFGYSSLLMALKSTVIVYTFEVNEKYADIAEKIHKHAGYGDRIKVMRGPIQAFEDFFKIHGSFGMVFIDHWKTLYLPDLHQLQEKGAIKKGTVVVGDNIIYPGAPDYHQFFKKSQSYRSVLYLSHNYGGLQKDGVLVSERVVE